MWLLSRDGGAEYVSIRMDVTTSSDWDDDEDLVSYRNASEQVRINATNWLYETLHILDTNPELRKRFFDAARGFDELAPRLVSSLFNYAERCDAN